MTPFKFNISDIVQRDQYAPCMQHEWTILPTRQHEYGSGCLSTTNPRLNKRFDTGKH